MEIPLWCFATLAKTYTPALDLPDVLRIIRILYARHTYLSVYTTLRYVYGS